MIARRTLLVGAAGALGGCGFHPIYAPTARGGAVGPELAAIYVAVMAERPGQLLRQALQRRLEGTDAGLAKQYELSGGLAISAEAIGIQQDTSATRIRFNGSCSWTLRKLDVKSTLVTQGTARVTDGLNINDQEYFASDLETGTVYRRIAETIAQQITLDLATYFREQKDKTA